MRLLIVATKAPWPPIDGGRLLLARTLEALASLGVRARLVAPVGPRDAPRAAIEAALSRWCEPQLVPVRSSSRLGTLLRVARSGAPWSIARHRIAAVGATVRRCLAEEQADLIHAEQLQAFTQAEAASEGTIPILLRTQNVESDLWSAAPGGGLLRAEARRLARWEGRAVARSALTLALSRRDAERLAALAAAVGKPRSVEVLLPPFPAELDPGTDPLPGAPAVVVMGSAGWYPNRDAVDWFLTAVWPGVQAVLPKAVLHVFGGRGRAGAGTGIQWHAAPEDSAGAFARGAVLAVPLRIGSGVRMKILEAWARGVPVVATPEALAGLELGADTAALVARDAEEFAAALSRLLTTPGLAGGLIASGREVLRRHHDPSAVAARLLALYEQAIGLFQA
jgi:hypothetical protein